MNSNQQQPFDLIIAGGGASGMALALAVVQRSQLTVAIIESNPSANQKSLPTANSLDLRSVAMSAFSCDFLTRLGIDELAELAQPIEHIHISDQGHGGQARLHCEEFQRAYLGQVIELNVLNDTLLRQLQSQQGTRVSWFCPDKISAVEKLSEKVLVRLDSGLTLSGKLLVVAEGGNSATRQLAGIGASKKDYGQSAIVANVVTDKSHHNWAYERFTCHGPIAMLPMRSDSLATAQRQCSLVWTVDEQDVEKVLGWSDRQFLQALQQQFGYRLSRLVETGSRQAFPLSLITCEQHTSHRVALIGNAAQSLHPIAGQGLNLGIRDIAQLTNLILANPDPGCFDVLHAYQGSRSKDQRQTIAATDSLVSIFSNAYLPMVVGRNLGLLAMQSCQSIKRIFAMHAMGYKDTRQIHAKL